MKTKLLILLLFSCQWFSTKAQHPPVFEGMTTDTMALKLNDLDISLVRYQYKMPGISFLAVHDDEDTGVKAAFDYIKLSGGQIIDSQYGSVRNFQFSYNGVNFQTDPNSIYSSEGARTGLEKYGKSDEKVVEQLGHISDAIMTYYKPEKLGYIFTLHNNADGGFGINSYLPDGELGDVADSVHVNIDMDPDDLVLVTEKALFKRLKAEDINVVLQAKHATDDGSMSIYAMQNKIPYINVEVQHGHQEENLRLIEIAARILQETYPALHKKAGQ